ncbi:Zn(2)-C6 fungal-type domain-containing protein [Mycena indigotica]|uniref:Zn(2)-C6 fungal-type domain-containing protein n=1 Tax=Mycena indigotica TaxID=2126181 RepID=A0A8H6WH28_9AGAR|nr:Zn(2)-C6 fungal-type domain-containing protein [Mycena indigotica]KAF7312069.1 Zn(2)-C6 fungal-type domain-containing protein [Mycena indigotica]
MPHRPCTRCLSKTINCVFGGVIADRKSYLELNEIEACGRLLNASNFNSSFGINRHLVPCAAGPGVILAALSIRSMNTPAPTRQDATQLRLLRDEQLHLSRFGSHFYGEASTPNLVRIVLEIREDAEKQQLPLLYRRLKYWTFEPLKQRVSHTGPLVFPPPDLLMSLVDLYFRHSNIHCPILHRPSFERAIAREQHLHDLSFGRNLLLVCGIGSRFSRDERICRPGMNLLNVGREFFNQLLFQVDHLFATPTEMLHHIQFYALAVTFLELSAPMQCWTLVGIGLRIGQDIGVHRKHRSNTSYSELRKRAFWALVCKDRQLGLAHGRPCMIRFEDLDAELPLECDDEYWDTEVSSVTEAFIQPAGKPSYISFFNLYIRLNCILGVSMDLLYSIDKAKALLAYGDSLWEARIVSQLDSALSEWLQTIPHHLRWDPEHQPDKILLKQSATLYCTYYHVQITIHRSLLQTEDRLKAPSFTICTTAAQSCVRLLDSLESSADMPNICPAIFASAMMLVLNLGNGSLDQESWVLDGVKRCMRTLKLFEERWQNAGLMWDLLYNLAIREDLKSEL